MRYQMLVYPTLAIIAAWAVFALVAAANGGRAKIWRALAWLRAGAVVDRAELCWR